MIGTKIHITGIVQGVGFRPFVYNEAIQQGLSGWVCNTSAGVDIEVYGDRNAVSIFIQHLNTNFPILARIDTIEHKQIPYIQLNSFEIIHSKQVTDSFQPISPDICICQDCLNELFDQTNRRFRYPFINCTNCGPRLTIIEEIPYDRPYTTMKDFKMCPDCEREYLDPTDRRFHAQPIACPVCGPKVWLELPAKKRGAKNQFAAEGDEAIITAQKLLINGKIIAIKGLGGFHLACDATNPKAVAELRNRKFRIDKPFALMLADIASIEAHCLVDGAERELLSSRQRPIVVLSRRINSSIAKEVSPNQNTLGIMLPYSPLHYLLFSQNSKFQKRNSCLPPLVMTSGNLSEEPIAVNNDEAFERLSGLADAYLVHNRSIRTRCDDSVIRTFRGASFPLRRSRGYAPFPVYLNSKSLPILAVGAELKNTFCVVRDRYAFLSHHIGDMENVETYDSFVDSITHYESLFRIKPVAIAHDRHPNYLASRYAIDRGVRENLSIFGIQHHHAHIAACMAENGIFSDEPVIGVAFDGTGFGDDGAIWGGEFLLSDFQGFKRVCHLKYVPLPGGDASIRKPARIALAYLWTYNHEWDLEHHPVSELCAEEKSILKSQLELKINTPFTSSMGRFFDAIASIVGVRQKINYEAQAAIEFETLVDENEEGEYSWRLERLENSSYPIYQINPAVLIGEVLSEVQNGTSNSIISARFHNSISRMVSEVCKTLRSDFGINRVVLSGGVWQNMTLLHRTCDLLESEKFQIHYHHLVPTNDGGVALGQAVIAIQKMLK